MTDRDTFSSFVIPGPGKDLVCRRDSISDQRANLPPEGVLVKVHAAGVCHTDVHQWLGGYKLSDTEEIRFADRPKYGYPRVPGHEMSGVVFCLGSNIPPELCDLKEGDRVAVFPWLGCGECKACKLGEETYCHGESRELGMTQDGGYAEYAIIPHYRFLVKILPVISYEVAATLGCGCLTAYNAVKAILPTVKKAAQFSASVPVGVLGAAGGLGQWALTLAQNMFKDHNILLIAIDVKKETLENLVHQNLADKALVIDPSKPAEEAIEQARSMTNGGFHAVLDFVNNPATFNLTQGMLSSHGEHVCIGLFGGSTELKLALVPLKRTRITGVQTGSLSDFRELLDLICTQPLSPPLFTYYKLSMATQALKDLEKGTMNGRGVLKIVH